MTRSDCADVNAVSDEQVETLVARAKPRVESAMALPQFTPGMAEVNVFDVAGQRAVADCASDAVRDLGSEAVRRAKSGLVRDFGARNPERGWIGFAMFLSVVASVLAAAFASGIRSDPADVAIVATILAVVGALANAISLAASRLRPLNRFVLRMQLVTCVALAAAVALSFSHGLVWPATAQLVCLIVTVIVGLVIVAVRRRDAEATEEIDLCVERAYLSAIDEVEAGAREAQQRLNAELDPGAAAVILRVRTVLFADLGKRNAALAAFDPSAPVGSALIAAKTDPDRWLPAALAKTRKRPAR
ncbi:hypothetical protein [Microbacterium sp. AISO3]|uniref:hypothetical protein n=1 Tax=Microbacterium sp. AISO3 TaxID=2002831 RepID=UPI001132752A|nr:hypothetical protein [Microbacterium sp. AISO3]